MALITSCQASFQNVAGYEDDIAALQENVRECYSEISKSSEQIRLDVREDYISRSEMATIQQDFQSTITQNSSEIRMDFSTITDELKDNIATNQELLEEYIRFKGALIELGKVGNAFTAELSNNELAFKENGQKIAYISNNSLAMLELTRLPVIAHDSVMLKHIEDDAIEKIVELYASTPKQVFIAMDKEGSYTPKTQKILEATKILQLSPGAGALFGRTWNDVERT